MTISDLPKPQAQGRSFRLVCSPAEVPLVEDLLREQGFDFEPEPFWPQARRLTGASGAARPLGDSAAARFGLVYIQDRSSMLPPLLLAPPPGATVLDMCASPGSKTGMLAQLVGPEGFVLGNEPSRDRLDTLRSNMRRLNLPRAATCSQPAERIGLPDGSWPYILLDPPCSGWGTVRKNPKVMELWTEEKTEPLIVLQRRLLERAAGLLAPGGRMVYSTCTTHVRENEEQVRWALDTLPLTLVPASPPPGIVAEEPRGAGVDGCLRVDAEASGAQGFFVALFEKKGDGGVARDMPEGSLRQVLPGREVPRRDFSGLRLDEFGPGSFFDFKGKVFFLPEQALRLMPAGLKWQGFLAGRRSAGVFRPDPRSRLFLPEPAGEGCFEAGSATELERLLAGESLERGARKGGGAVGLYYRSLRLGFLRATGSRVVWPAG